MLSAHHAYKPQPSARDGRKYLHDIWKIVEEFSSSSVYNTNVDLAQCVQALKESSRLDAIRVVDVSDRFDDVSMALDFVERWAITVHEARSDPRLLYVLRRTPENSASILMIQRQFSLRECCDESSPAAYVVLHRAQQMLVPRDDVRDADETLDRILDFVRDAADATDATDAADAADARRPDDSKDSTDAPAAAKPDATPTAIFEAQLKSIRAIRQIIEPPARDDNVDDA